MRECGGTKNGRRMGVLKSQCRTWVFHHYLKNNLFKLFFFLVDFFVCVCTIKRRAFKTPSKINIEFSSRAFFYTIYFLPYIRFCGVFLSLFFARSKIVNVFKPTNWVNKIWHRIKMSFLSPRLFFLLFFVISNIVDLCCLISSVFFFFFLLNMLHIYPLSSLSIFCDQQYFIYSSFFLLCCERNFSQIFFFS